MKKILLSLFAFGSLYFFAGTTAQAQPTSCYGFYNGQNVYETSTGTYKTANILNLDCANRTARIRFYGSWGGDYTVTLQQIIPVQYAPVDCHGYYVGQNVYEISTGTYKTATILSLDCANRSVRIRFYGSWGGDYTVNFSSIISEQNAHVDCQGFYNGQSVYETSTGTYKTANILSLDCANRSARIRFYGNWGGDYTVPFYSIVAQQNAPVDCQGFYLNEPVYEISTGVYKTARITRLDCANRTAIIQMYGNWSGQYTVPFRSLMGQF